MFGFLDLRLNERTLTNQRRLAEFRWLIFYVGLLFLSVLIGYTMLGADVTASYLGWLVYLFSVAAIFYNPRFGLYLTLPFVLAGDYILASWWPFALNFSSRESLLYINDSVIVSPLETFLIFIYISWFIRMLSKRNFTIYRGKLFWPIVSFAGFIAFGFIYGVIIKSGDFTIGLWESRPIFYLPMTAIAASNLLEKREHLPPLMWGAIAALLFEGINGTLFFMTDMNYSFSGFNEITAHSAAIHMNSVFLFVFLAWYFRIGLFKQLALLTVVPPILLTYFATQRRAAFLALGVSLVISYFYLYRDNRRAFLIITPLIGMFALGYTIVFWNVGGPLGMPAQAIKSVTSNASEEDARSNAYRMLENINSWSTVKTYPLTGVGFGQKFLLVVPMPDISFFAWWEYITHNSILWIWMKAGAGGFISMLLIIGGTIMFGSQLAWRMPRGELAAITLTLTLYVLMHFLFAYVDMSWDQQSMVYVGTAVGVINALERIMNTPVPEQKKRWSWQKEVESIPQLRSAESTFTTTQNES